MSRSYKKYMVIKDSNRCKKTDKRLAAKAVRNSENVPNGNAYKQCYDPYDICDDRVHYTLKQINEWTYEHYHNPYGHWWSDRHAKRLQKEFKTYESYLKHEIRQMRKK